MIYTIFPYDIMIIVNDFLNESIESNKKKYKKFCIDKIQLISWVLEKIRWTHWDLDYNIVSYIMKQPIIICLLIVKQNGMALKYVKKQTPKICMMAVKQNPYALKYVINKQKIFV